MATFATEDFIVDASKKQILEKHWGKVERLFKVKIALDVVSKVGGIRRQWIAVSGSQENRKNAKAYILAMCHPEQTKQLTCNTRRPVDDVVLEEVEQETSAFLTRTGSYSLQVMGSELSCILAVSQLEHTYPVTVDDEDDRGQRKMDRGPPALSPSPTGISDQVEALNMDCADPNRPDSIDDHHLFASGQNLGESKENPITLSPAKRRDHTADSREKAQTAQGSGESSSAVEEQKANFLSICQGMGYTELEIHETLPFFDFTDAKHPVQISEFLIALEEVRSSKQADENAAGAAQQGEGVGAGKPVPSKKGAKKGKGKVAGKSGGQSVSVSPVKQKAASSSKKPQSTDTASSQAGSSSLLAKGGCRGLVAEARLIVEDDRPDDSNKKKTTSQDDSVIVLDDSLNDSVCIVGAFFPSPATRASGQKDTGQALPSSSGCKRKEYSDDEEQTVVLKPYSTNIPGCEPPSVPAPVSQPVPAAMPPICDIPLPAPAQQQMEIAGNEAEIENRNDELRFIVIDGSNVAMSHGNDKVFSCKGIKLCVEYFLKRGHRVKAWVPRTKSYRNQDGRHPPIVDQEILEELKDKGYLGFTPARKLGNKHIVSHDDYFILDLAKLEDAVIVSLDNFREFLGDYRDIITTRVLSYVFAGDHFMLPKDPLGRYGPTLEEFLRKVPKQLTARGGEAGPQQFKTFGQNNPAFRFPTANNMVPYPAVPGQAPLRFPPANSMVPYSAVAGPAPIPRGPPPVPMGRFPGQTNPHRAAVIRPTMRQEQPNLRHPDVTRDLLVALKSVFPEKAQESKIQQVLDNHREETDLNKLTNYCIGAMGM